MEFTIQDFPEMERFFLIELSYLDFQDMDLGNVSFVKPIPLSDIMAVLDQADSSARFMIPEYRSYLQKMLHRLRTIFHASKYLQKMKLVGYINDNGNAYGTTKNFWKSGLVAQAYSDHDGNVILTYRGTEASSLTAAAHDWESRLFPYLGMVSTQFKRAHAFFKEIAAKVKGKLIVAGDGLGGSLALYTYIQEKETMPDLTGLAISGKKDAFLWRRLSAEKYLTTGDFIFQRHVSKGIRKDMVDEIFHNLEMTQQEKKLSFFKGFEDFVRKNRAGGYQKVLPELMEKLKDYTQADALCLWFCHEDNNGKYIIPYTVCGDLMQGIKHLKLREGETAICTAAFLGIGKLYTNLREIGLVSFGHQESENEAMMCVPILCSEKPIGAIQLSKAGTQWQFHDEMYEQAAAFAERLGEYLNPYRQEIFYDDDYLIQIYDRTIQKPVFSMAEYENRTMAFSRRRACEGIVSRLQGKNLASHEVLRYKGNYYTGRDKNFSKDFGFLFEKEFKPSDRLSIVLKPYYNQEKVSECLEELEQTLSFRNFEDRAFADLTIKEKLIFHTVACFVKQPVFLVIYPYLYAMEEKLREWADSMLLHLAARMKKTVLKLVIEE